MFRSVPRVTVVRRVSRNERNLSGCSFETSGYYVPAPLDAGLLPSNLPCDS